MNCHYYFPYSPIGDYLEKCIAQVLTQSASLIDITNQSFSIRNYSDTIETIGAMTQELARKLLVKTIEETDAAYCDSSLRKRYYYVKTTRERTPITMFGKITYRRMIYQDKATVSKS